MKTITVKATADSEGTLQVDVPTGVAAGECEIVIRVNDPKVPSGWLPGFWETLREAAAQRKEPSVRPPQPECDERTHLR
jgi:hypothetical protein